MPTKAHPLAIAISAAQGAHTLRCTLDLPPEPRAVVILASAGSVDDEAPGIVRIMRSLRNARIATLRANLLAPGEAADDEAEHTLSTDVRLLADRLKTVISWAVRQDELRGLPLGISAKGLSAAAAIAAAAELPQHVAAIVSRGGRPELAGAGHLALVEAPILLLVGGRDEAVLQLNEEAKDRMHAAMVELELVPDALHDLDAGGDGGTLAAERTARWLEHHLILRRPEAAQAPDADDDLDPARLPQSIPAMPTADDRL